MAAFTVSESSDGRHRRPAHLRRPLKCREFMKNSLIAVLLVTIGLTQLSWPMVGDHAAVKQTSEVAGAARHDHSMSNGQHDCCPQVSASFMTQPPATGPCDSRHQCCVSSNDVPALPASPQQSRSDFDLARLSLEQTAPTIFTSASTPPRGELPSRNSFLVVLRI